MRAAIKQMGLGNYESINTMQFIPSWTDITINLNFRLDSMTSVKGLEHTSFDALLEKATNRPKDILDIEELEKINKKSNS